MKTALAPSVALATPKVKRFAEKLRAALGHSALLIDFYACEPSAIQVEDREGNKWIEGSWGAHIEVHTITAGDIYDLNRISEIIEISEVAIKPRSEHRIELSIWLTARVMRY